MDNCGQPTGNHALPSTHRCNGEGGSRAADWEAGRGGGTRRHRQKGTLGRPTTAGGEGKRLPDPATTACCGGCHSSGGLTHGRARPGAARASQPTRPAWGPKTRGKSGQRRCACAASPSATPTTAWLAKIKNSGRGLALMHRLIYKMCNFCINWSFYLIDSTVQRRLLPLTSRLLPSRPPASHPQHATPRPCCGVHDAAVVPPPPSPKQQQSSLSLRLPLLFPPCHLHVGLGAMPSTTESPH